MIHADLLVSYNGPMGGSRGVDRVASHPGAFSRGWNEVAGHPAYFVENFTKSKKRYF